jgi:predicted ATP-dependent serine protease
MLSSQIDGKDAMAKSKEVFICQNCGASSPKWQGQCAACGEWNTLVAELLQVQIRAP